MKKLLSLLLTVLILFSCLFNTNIATNAKTLPNMSIAFIDCGQGDSILISSNGYNMLVDAGKKSNVASVTNYLNQQDIQDLDYVVASHTHEDHIGGLPTIYENFQVKNSIYPNYVDDTITYNEYVRAIQQEPQSDYYSVNKNESWSLGDVTVKVISDGKNAKTVNDSSLVLKLTCGDIDLLLTGDISSTIENQIVASGENIESEILKVAHHGSATSSSAEFLNSVSPEISVFSVGKNNQYNHPHIDTTLRVSSVSSKIFRTDLQGTILINVENNSIKYNSILEDIQKDIYCKSKTVYTTQNGTKYHASSLCSNMKSPIAKQLEEAKKAGYSPCSKCVTKDFEQQLSPHKLDNGTITNNATCKNNGTKIYKCTKCNLILKTEVIPKNSTHYYETFTTNATYTKSGSVIVTCAVCNTIKSTKTIAKLVPKKTKISKLTAKKKSLVVKVKKEKTVTGYQIQYSLKKNFKGAKTVTIKKNSTITKTIKKLKSKKTYYVRVRTYKVENGKKYYSDWSKTSKKKTK